MTPYGETPTPEQYCNLIVPHFTAYNFTGWLSNLNIVIFTQLISSFYKIQLIKHFAQTQCTT